MNDDITKLRNENIPAFHRSLKEGMYSSREIGMELFRSALNWINGLEKVASDAITRAENAEAEAAALQARVGQVANMARIQSQEGNWNYSEYMLGLANGLLLAHATMTGSAYEPFSRPAQWIEEAKRTPPTEAPAP